MWKGKDGVDGFGEQGGGRERDAGMGLEFGELCVVCKRLGDSHGGKYVNIKLIDPARSGNVVYDTGCCFVHRECEAQFFASNRQL